MNDIIIIKSVFFFMCLWGLSLVLLWFRPRIEIFWKIVATLILLFYCWFFFDEILKGLAAFRASWYVSVLDFLRELITLVFINLFFLWPLALVVIFYKANDMGSERLLKFMCVLTLVLWVIFVIYFYYHAGIDRFFYENLKKMIPHAK
jgi:hypothetical protein